MLHGLSRRITCITGGFLLRTSAIRLAGRMLSAWDHGAARIVAVRNVLDDEFMEFSFKYENASLGLPEKRFNLRRRKEEPLHVMLQRMSTNIASAIEKKRRKKKKQRTTEEDAVPPLSIILQHDGQPLATDTKNVDAWQDGAVLNIDGTAYKVCVNAPKVVSLTLPTNVMRGFPVYPKVKLEFASLEESEFEWHAVLADRPVEVQLARLEPVGRGFYYTATADDVGKRLHVTCTPKRGDLLGLEVSSLSQKVVEEGPGPCPFEERHAHTATLTDEDRLRCVSYNILADLYADSDFSRESLFPYCPPECLEIDYRKQLFLREILGYNADIICLQEVDSKIYEHDLVPFLRAAGLKGLFMEKGGKVVEGLACFAREDKLKIVDTSNIILAEVLESEPSFADIFAAIKANEKLLARVLKRTTAVQTVLLESVQRSHEMILVGNTHLYFHPDADHIRLLQAAMTIRYLENQLNAYKEQYAGKSISVILCGDFNSCPEFGVLRLVTTGHVPHDIPDWQSNAEEAVSGLSVRHSLDLGSACGCPPYTNYTVGFSGCLDYIFYDRSRLEVEHVVPLPTHKQVTRYTALPNKVFPSDHLALVCTLKWKKPSFDQTHHLM